MSQPFAVIHICKPHKPTHRPKLPKEYAYPNAQKQRLWPDKPRQKKKGERITSASI